MIEIAQIPLSQIAAIPAGKVVQTSGSAVLITAPAQWSYSAAAVFELPQIESHACAVTIRLHVQRGELGVGWLDRDDSAWIARALVADTSAPAVVSLLIPQNTVGGRLVFDNATEGGRPAVALIRSITIEGAEVPASEQIAS